MKTSTKSLLLITGILLLDQISKILIKTNLLLGESIPIFDWFQIYFIENPGMAFGMTIGSKQLLTLFRIVLIAFILYYMIWLIKQNYKTSYILCLSVILAGAIGNVIDSLFYGLMFGESTFFSVSKFFPSEGGYAPFLQGKVVDMLYFPLFTIPEWVPFWGGEIFFSPVFNIADSAISVGIVILFFFFRKDFSETLDKITKKRKTKQSNE